VRFPPAPGGVETHVLQISKVLKKRGHHVKVFSSDLYTETPFKKFRGRGQLPKRVEKVEGVEVHRFRARTLGGEMHYVLTPRMFPSILSTDTDILHAHSYGYFHMNLAAYTRKMRGIPFVLTPHFHPEWSMWGGEKRRSLRKIYDKYLGARAVDCADVVICVSRAEADQLARLDISKDRIRIIPNGVDMDRFTPVPGPGRFREFTGIDSRFVLYTGRLATNKGLEYLIEAFADVKKNHKDMELVLVGQDNGVGPDLRKRARRLGIQDSLHLTGHIPDDDAFKSAYAACDLFVLPSEYEAFGIVLVEAMACEKPCVGSNMGGIPEVIDDGKTGFIVDYADSGKLSDAMNRILDDDRRARDMGRLGRKRVEERFTWEKVVDELESVYGELAGNL
jgi:glycosyltransferase involved in cell wall biosynthesis